MSSSNVYSIPQRVLHLAKANLPTGTRAVDKLENHICEPSEYSVAVVGDSPEKFVQQLGSLPGLTLNLNPVAEPIASGGICKVVQLDSDALVVLKNCGLVSKEDQWALRIYKGLCPERPILYSPHDGETLHPTDAAKLAEANHDRLNGIVEFVARDKLPQHLIEYGAQVRFSRQSDLWNITKRVAERTISALDTLIPLYEAQKSGVEGRNNLKQAHERILVCLEDSSDIIQATLSNLMRINKRMVRELFSESGKDYVKFNKLLDQASSRDEFERTLLEIIICLKHRLKRTNTVFKADLENRLNSEKKILGAISALNHSLAQIDSSIQFEWKIQLEAGTGLDFEVSVSPIQVKMPSLLKIAWKVTITAVIGYGVGMLFGGQGVLGAIIGAGVGLLLLREEHIDKMRAEAKKQLRKLLTSTQQEASAASEILHEAVNSQLYKTFSRFYRKLEGAIEQNMRAYSDLENMSAEVIEALLSKAQSDRAELQNILASLADGQQADAEAEAEAA